MQSRSALPLARGLPCERFTAALASRNSCITRGRGGWLDLPRGGLAPPILCQLPGALRVGSISEVGTRNREVRGRDASYLAPPAQIRTGPIRAYGSRLGCLTAKRLSGHG